MARSVKSQNTNELKPDGTFRNYISQFNKVLREIIVFNMNGSQEFVDLNNRFGLGKEREAWEMIEKSANLEASNIQN